MIREYKMCIRLNENETRMLSMICDMRSLSPSETVRDLIRDEWKKLIENGQVVLARRSADGEVQDTEE